MKTLKILFITILTLSLAFSLPIYASSSTIPDEETLDFYDDTGNYYYNGVGGNECNVGSTQLTGSDTAEKIWNFFISQGFNDAQTAGILGNAQAESSLNITASYKSVWGLFQMLGDRRANLEAKITEAGLSQYLNTEDSSTIPEADFDRLLQVELEFTMSENDGNWQEEIKTADNPELAAEIFLTLYERAVGGETPILYYAPFKGKLYQATEKRRNYAREFYDKYAGKGTTISSSNSNSQDDGSDITIIGDSITVLSESTFKSKLPQVEIYAQNGKSLYRDLEDNDSGKKILENLLSNNQLRKTLILALGTNDSLTESDVESIISLIDNSTTVYLVNNYDSQDSNKYQNNNAAIQTIAQTRDNLSVIDWSSSASKAVNENPDTTYFTDNVHPSTPDGVDLFVETILNSLNKNQVNTCNGSADTGDPLAYLQQYIADTNFLYGTMYNIPTTANYGVPAEPLTPNSHGNGSLSSTNLSLLTSKYGAENIYSGGCWHGADCGQCSALSGWFVSMMTSYRVSGDSMNGYNVTNNISNANNLPKVSGTPTGYPSVFSEAGDPGHTGVVLKASDDGQYIIIENNYCRSGVVCVTKRSFDSSASFVDLSAGFKKDHLGTRYN